MKTIKRFFLSTAVVTAALITGCTPEEEHMPVQGGDSFTLSSIFSVFALSVRLKITAPAYSIWLLKNSPKFFL